MDELEEIVDPKVFFRANRQTIIQMDAVDNFKTDHYGQLSVKIRESNSEPVDISREKAAAFKAWLSQ